METTYEFEINTEEMEVTFNSVEECVSDKED